MGAGLNTNIGFLVMSFGFSDPGCLAIFLAALSFHPTLFLSFCDRSAHRYTCRCRGQLHLFLFPSHTGSPLIVRDLGGPYGPLFRTFCVSVSSYLTWPTTERHFLSAGCSLSIPGGDCLFSINLTLFLTGLGILACATHQGMYPPHTVSLCGSLPREAECWPLPVTKLSAEG